MIIEEIHAYNWYKICCNSRQVSFKEFKENLMKNGYTIISFDTEAKMSNLSKSLSNLPYYPISRCKNFKWVFVKNVRGYENAISECKRLQKKNKSGWEYRVWDNR